MMKEKEETMNNERAGFDIFAQWSSDVCALIVGFVAVQILT